MSANVCLICFFVFPTESSNWQIVRFNEWNSVCTRIEWNTMYSLVNIGTTTKKTREKITDKEFRLKSKLRVKPVDNTFTKFTLVFYFSLIWLGRFGAAADANKNQIPMFSWNSWNCHHMLTFPKLSVRLSNSCVQKPFIYVQNTYTHNQVCNFIIIICWNLLWEWKHMFFDVLGQNIKRYVECGRFIKTIVLRYAIVLFTHTHAHIRGVYFKNTDQNKNS